MTHNLKVTIGLCVKNAEKTIKETLRSIIEQNFPRELMELIIVDGCSKDKTLSLIEKELLKADMKSRIFIENKGLGYARQIVANNATGDYIIWVDGDMILPRNFVKQQVEFMERNPKVGIAKGRYGIIKENSIVANLENIEFVMTFSKQNDTASMSLGTSGCIYRIGAINQVGGFDENIKGVGEDTDIEYRIKTAGWNLCISPAYFYERRRKTWHALWKEYFWHGKGAFYIYKKNPKTIIAPKMIPLIILIKKLIQIPYTYRLTRQKAAILLPFHYIFKRTAWLFGFLTEYISNLKANFM
ncbi:MAG: glycosyltransferase [Candidatus Bathyarchaeia archaeon]